MSDSGATTKSVRDPIRVNQAVEFVRNVFSSRRIILELAVNDLRSRYLGSYLGPVWAIVQPVMTVLVLWFVFAAGFKIRSVGDIPFVLWLSCGFLPWLFISDGVVRATTSITEYSFLVKKIVFRVSILPLVKISSSLIVHLVFAALVILMFVGHKYYPDRYFLQLPYYMLMTGLMMLGISWLTSALTVFVRDLGQAVSVVMQFGFWLTPVFWSSQSMPEKLQFWIKLNPAYYIVEGYRDSLINKVWFWEKPELTLYFLVLTLLFLALGAIVFIRLRPHFADAL